MSNSSKPFDEPFEDLPGKVRDPELDPRDKPRPRPHPWLVDPDPEPLIQPRDDLDDPPRA